MQAHCTQIPYSHTGSFSKLVMDYLDGVEALKPFYKYAPNLDGIQEAMKARGNFAYRDDLVRVLHKQYDGLPVFEPVMRNLELLLNKNTFTITTAHQPNIFTGPLYVIYKILHVIKLASVLQETFPGKNFIPVFYMGSEDADLDELNHITVEGKSYQWMTAQTGAVGRMCIDEPFLQMMNDLQGQLGVLPFGNELINLFHKSYQKGNTIQQSTLHLINELFGKYGLVVLIPDNRDLKKIFEPTILQELETQFSHHALEPVKNELGKNYKVQTAGRELNLFYLLKDKRERIERVGEIFKVKALGLEFSQKEIIEEVKNFPERFSGNVILRGPFQETVLPNIVFIGGGGELAYWLELGKVFDAMKISYPVLVLRNSFLIMEERHQKVWKQIAFRAEDLFLSKEELAKNYVIRLVGEHQLIDMESGMISQVYNKILEKAKKADETLAGHVIALKKKNEKLLRVLEKKMIRAEKRKHDDAIKKIEYLKSSLFPQNSLQERVENFSGFYARYGSAWIEEILQCSEGLKQSFTLVHQKKNQ
ncbi:MAG: bacillithiol biosynthesis cysteine-adding enzyme BshC [Bacteroidetes bacterium]|nr:bacillithiol biosynthesis cysteine-adding enzyme BshC [Bacteroidota bacterium]